jgi:hypothetical protein
MVDLPSVVVEQVRSAVAALATTNAATDTDEAPAVEVVTVAATLGMASNVAVNALFESVNGARYHGKLKARKLMAAKVVATVFDDAPVLCGGGLCVGKIVGAFKSKLSVGSFNN